MYGPSTGLSRVDLMVSLQRQILLLLKAQAKFWFISVLTSVGTKCIYWWTSMQEGSQGRQGQQGWSTTAAHLNIQGQSGVKGGTIELLQGLQPRWLLLTWTRNHGPFWIALTSWLRPASMHLGSELELIERQDTRYIFYAGKHELSHGSCRFPV